MPSEVPSPPPVDLEMLCQSLVLQGLEIASTFKCYAESTVQTLQRRYCQAPDADGDLLDAVLSLWCWAQRKCRSEEAQVTKELLLPIPQPVACQLNLQPMGFITESFDDMKTQLQLIHAAVDSLQSKGEPTCRCEPQERRTRVVAPLTKKFSSSSNAQTVRVPGASCETPMFQINRLEVPMWVDGMEVHRPSTLHEHSGAILYWIIQAIDGSHTHPDNESGQRFPLRVANDTSSTSAPLDTTVREILASAPNSAGQYQFEQQDDTNAGQDPVMDIAQIYQVLARDGL
ncbi:hypothetical protein V7S43_017238 [Phytophthora oleae]|uniref:Uncharacterized protein n=1 Tax=Phytophthora oleae TaxID=2107226 RepID=A0ABD3EV60_9STRA